MPSSALHRNPRRRQAEHSPANSTGHEISASVQPSALESKTPSAMLWLPENCHIAPDTFALPPESSDRNVLVPVQTALASCTSLIPRERTPGSAKCRPSVPVTSQRYRPVRMLSLIHISEPTRLLSLSYAVF